MTIACQLVTVGRALAVLAFADDGAGFLGCSIEAFGGLADLAASRGDRFAGFSDDDLGDLFFAFAESVGDRLTPFRPLDDGRLA